MKKYISVTVFVVCLLFVFSGGSMQAAMDPDTTYPIGYYEFNELGQASGDVTLDMGFSTNPASDGLLHGNAVIASDTGGNGKGASKVLSYTGDAIGGVICQELAKYNNPGSISVAAWIKLSSNDIYPPFVQKYHSFKLAATRDANFDFYGRGLSMRGTTSLTNSDTWHHVVATYDSATGAGYLYVDGVEEQSDPSAADFAANDNLMVIGGTIYDVVRLATCKIDDVAVYDVALDSATITDIYNSGPAMDKAHGHSPFNAEGFDLAAPPTTLSWTNSRNATASAAVWFGTNPGSAGTVLGNDTLLNTSATIPETLVIGTTYYWRVDETQPSALPGRMVSFEILPANATPDVDAGLDREVWLAEGTIDVVLDGAVIDDGNPGPYTVQWSEISGPGTASVIVPDDAEDAIATMTEAGTYVLQLAAYDGEKTGTDTVEIIVHDEAAVVYPIGYYEFNELGKDAGDITLDLGGSASVSDGLIHGTASIVADAGGNGKPASRVVYIPGGGVGGGVLPQLRAKYADMGDISIAMWIQSNGGVYHAYARKHNCIEIRQVADVGYSVYGLGIAIFSSTGGTGGTGHNSDQNRWDHLICTYDTTTGDGKMYINGSLYKTDNGAPGGLPDVDNSLYFGNRIADGSDDSFYGPYTNQFSIDDIAVYDVVIGDGVAVDIYNNGPASYYAHGHSPFNEEEPSTAPATLTWQNARNATGSRCLWFGTDQYNPSPIILTGTPTNLEESAAVPETLVVGNTYYWRVDNAYDPSGTSLNAGRMVSFGPDLGEPPVADAGPDQQVYLTEGTVDVLLDGTASSDDGIPAALTYTWTEVTPSGNLSFDNTYPDTPTATITAVGTYTLNLNVSDTAFDDDDQVVITVYADACAYAQDQPGFAWDAGDVNFDCCVNIDDLNYMASVWLNPYTFVDFAAVAAEWQTCKNPPFSFCGDGICDPSIGEDYITCLGDCPIELPTVTNEAPAAGKRVRITATGYENTDVYHTLYLPADWVPGGKYPVIIEYAPNSWAPTPETTVDGSVEDTLLGFYQSGGAGFIWATMPFIDTLPDPDQNAAGWWWGQHPAGVVGEDVAADYTKAGLIDILEDYGGDGASVFVTGFSRGAIACGQVGLRDQLVDVWLGMMPHSHHYQLASNNAPTSYPLLDYLAGRASFITYGGPADGGAGSSIVGVNQLTWLGFPVESRELPGVPHTHNWIKDDAAPTSLAVRQDLRDWLADTIANRTGTSSITGQVTENTTGNPISGVRIQSGDTHWTYSDSNGNYELAGLIDSSRTLTASHDDHDFVNPTRPVTISGSDLTNQNFITVP